MARLRDSRVGIKLVCRAEMGARRDNHQLAHGTREALERGHCPDTRPYLVMEFLLRGVKL